ncbi:hypothetical protein ACT7DB_30670 [Bacillus cereus]
MSLFIKKIELVTKQQERLQDNKSKQKLHSYTWLKEQIETSAYRQLEEKHLHVYIQEQPMELQGEYSVRMYEKNERIANRRYGVTCRSGRA